MDITETSTRPPPAASGAISDAGTMRPRSNSQHSRSGTLKLAIKHEVLHSLQEAVIVVGKDEKVELYNETAFELWGLPEDVVIGAHYSLLLGRDADITPGSKSHQRILTKHQVNKEVCTMQASSLFAFIDEQRISTNCEVSGVHEMNIVLDSSVDM